MDQDGRFIAFDKGVPTGRRGQFVWMIDALLSSRREAGLDTGTHRPDEDVNMYLADLLCRQIAAGGAGDDAIIPYDGDLHERAAGLSTLRSRYLLYRANADHLLIGLGLFDNPWRRKPNQAAFRWAPTRRDAIARGKWYYHQASLYARRLGEGRRGMDDLLARLAIGFEDYLKILETLRGEHFNLVKRFSDGEWAHLCRDLGIAFDSAQPTGV